MGISARLIKLSIIVLFLFFFPSDVLAQTKKEGSLEVSPAYLEVVLEKAMQEQTIELFYTNHSQKPVSLEVYPIDFKQQNEQGGVSFLGNESGSYSYSLASFLSFETNRIDLEPKERRVLTIKVTNRQDLSPGGHYAAVIARQIQANRDTTISPAISTLILLRKTGGERFNLSIKNVDWPSFLLSFSYPNAIDVTFQNEGNIHLVPYGRVEIRDLFGRLLFKGITNESSAVVFPESRRKIAVTMRQIERSFPLSFNTLTIKGNDSLKKTRFIYSESAFFIHPSLFLLPVGIILYTIIRRRRKVKGKR